jgi:pseudouridine synthase
MRINKFLAYASTLSRRAADTAIIEGRVMVNGCLPLIGQSVNEGDLVTLDNKILEAPDKPQTIMLNKPVGYVTSRAGQGSKTVYDLLPKELHQLIPIGRLDKDSSGLLLLTNDGDKANLLTHPSFGKQKIYQVKLNKPLAPADKSEIEYGIRVEDYTSRLKLSPEIDNVWQVTMIEGKNRQIRKTFARLGYEVIALHRINFGEYHLGNLKSGEFKKP